MKATIDKAGALQWKRRILAEYRAMTDQFKPGDRIQRGHRAGTITRIVGEALVDHGRIRTFRIWVEFDATEHA